MHRSGTSALTRVLNLLGLPLGQPLMPPHPGNNEAGFWELAGAVAINDRLLDLIGVPWDCPDSLAPAWLEEIPQQVFHDAAALIDGNFSDIPAFVLKDPRICRLWPFWLQVFSNMGVRTVAAHLLRPPAEVTASLMTRDRFSPERCASLWIRYTLEAEAVSSERILIAYDTLLSDPAGTIDDLRRWFSEVGIGLGNPAYGEIGAFLQPSLRHHRAVPPMRGKVGTLAEQLYCTLALTLYGNDSRASAIAPSRRQEIHDMLDRWIASRARYTVEQAVRPIEQWAMEDRERPLEVQQVPGSETIIAERGRDQEESGGPFAEMGERTETAATEPGSTDEHIVPHENGPAGPVGDVTVLDETMALPNGHVAQDPQSDAPAPTPELPAVHRAKRLRVFDFVNGGLLWLGLQAPSIQLIPDHQLLVTPDGDYQATGIDPWFTLVVSPGALPWGWPSGWYAVTLHGTANRDALSPKLYLDHGAGFSEESAIILPAEITMGKRELIHVKERMTQLRLDPAHRPARFRLDSIELRRVPALLVAARIFGALVSRAMGTQRISRQELGELWRLWRSDGLSGLDAALARDIDFKGRDYGWKPIGRPLA
jgi:hypothetical protein